MIYFVSAAEEAQLASMIASHPQLMDFFSQPEIQAALSTYIAANKAQEAPEQGKARIILL